MWISKKKHQAEITRVKNEEMWASIKRNAEVRNIQDIEQLKKDVKKLKKKVKELRNG
jgi:ubiquinone biosynthesis protein UbiJ